MTMINPALPSETLMGHVSFVLKSGPERPDTTQTPTTTRDLFGRATGNKPHGAGDFPYSNSHFGHNIWQSSWQTRLEKSFDPVGSNNGSYVGKSSGTDFTSQIGNKRPQPPSLALPNIKANPYLFENCGDRRSPIGSERSTARDSEPQSARSRSHHESNSLTPTSLSNDSELSLQAPNTSQDQKRQAGMVFSNGLNRDRTIIWPTAPEFQPSLPPIHRQISSSSYPRSSELQRSEASQASKPLLGHTFDMSIEGIWNQSKQPNFALEQRNVDATPLATKKSEFEFYPDRNFRSTNSRVNTFSTDMMALTWGDEQRQNAFAESWVNSQIALRPQSQQPLRRQTEPWSEHSHASNRDTAATGSNIPRPVFDEYTIRGMRSLNISSARQGTITENAIPVQPHKQPLPFQGKLHPQINEFRPIASQSYPHRVHEFGCGIDMSHGNAADYQNIGYGSQSIRSNPYTSYEPSQLPQSEATQLPRSQLLEEFRLHGKTKKYELKDIFGHIVEFSGDQLGSRFIQHKLEVANSEEKDQVFSEIACESRQLMTDLFGNYVVQKLFEHGNQSQKKVLAGHMKGHIIALSMQTYGCRVVQKALEHILTDQQASLIKELDGYVLKVVENQNGNHVIQKAIECIPGEYIQFIVDAHRGHVHALSKHAYGCRVIQRMLEHCNSRAKRQILDELHMNIGDLIQDPFGNYVVQHVIVNGEPQDRKPVIDKVQSRLLENSMHKFASNVVEKALDYAEEDQCQDMLRTLTSRDEQRHSRVLQLLGHQYGNYVIQKSASHLHGPALQALLEEMEQYLMQLRRVSNGKQIAALEGSVRDARQRLHDQRAQNYVHNAPTEPSRHAFVRH